jgi:hypothetical protein
MGWKAYWNACRLGLPRFPGVFVRFAGSRRKALRLTKFDKFAIAAALMR